MIGIGREAIRERDSKNKKEMHGEISKSPSNDINIKQTKKYDELVVAGIVIYAALVYVLRMLWNTLDVQLLLL